jgi:hypothetical protein
MGYGNKVIIYSVGVLDTDRYIYQTTAVITLEILIQCTLGVIHNRYNWLEKTPMFVFNLKQLHVPSIFLPHNVVW